MDKNDFFVLSGRDRDWIAGLEDHSIRFKGSSKSKPLVFIDLQRDELGNLLQIGAFFPEACFSRREILKNGEYIRCNSQWASFFVPIKSEKKNRENYVDLKTDILQSIQYYSLESCLIRCCEEKEALVQLVQFLSPLNYSLDKVSLVTWCEADIKYLLTKVSEFSLTQMFMSSTTDFLTVLGLVSWSVAPSSLDQLINEKEVDLKCLLSNSAGRSRALAHAFIGTGEPFNTTIERKEFSVLEEYFFMNYSVKLDEDHEDNTCLYVGDLKLNVTESNLRDIVWKHCNIVNHDYTIKLCKHPKTREFLGYALATFNNHDLALKALTRLNNEKLFDQPMRVVWHNKNNISSEKRASNLFVKDIEAGIDQKQLYETFQVFGKILSSKLALDTGTGRPKGFGFIQFDQEEDAQKAIEVMHGVRRKDKELFVSIKLTETERGKKLSHQQQQNNEKLRKAVVVSVGGYSQLDLEGAFQKMVQAGEIVFIKSNPARPSALVFIYASPRGAATAIGFDSSYFLGRRLQVDYFESWMNAEDNTPIEGTTLFVGNLDPCMNSDSLAKLFSDLLPIKGQSPTVIKAKVAMNESGASLLYGHVTLRSEYVNLAIAQFNGKMINGHRMNLHVEDAADPDEATTSKSKTLPPVKLGVKDPEKKAKALDTKNLLANRIQNAMRKKLKDAAFVSDATPSSPAAATRTTGAADASGLRADGGGRSGGDDGANPSQSTVNPMFQPIQPSSTIVNPIFQQPPPFHQNAADRASSGLGRHEYGVSNDGYNKGYAGEDYGRGYEDRTEGYGRSSGSTGGFDQEDNGNLYSRRSDDDSGGYGSYNQGYDDNNIGYNQRYGDKSGYGQGYDEKVGYNQGYGHNDGYNQGYGNKDGYNQGYGDINNTYRDGNSSFATRDSHSYQDKGFDTHRGYTAAGQSRAGGIRPEYGSHAKDGPQGNQRFIDMGDQAGQSFDGYGTDLRRRNSGHASSERNRREQDGRQVQPPSNIDSRQPPSWRNSAENYGETQQYHTGGGGGGYDHRQTDHDSQQYSGSGYSHSNVSNADYGIRGGADARIRGQSSNVPEPPHKLIDRGFGHQHNNLSRPSSARSRSRSRGRRSRSRGRRSRSRGRRSRSRSRGRDSYRRRRSTSRGRR